jgi:hypothetical protein
MANDEKQPKANLTSNSVILAIVVAASTYFVVHEAAASGGAPGSNGAEAPRESWQWVVPFEWFESDLSRQILVLWLDERVLADKPLEQLDRLVDVLRHQGVKSQLDQAKVTIRILGPEASDTLLSMAKEARDTQKEFESGCLHATFQIDEKWKNLKGVNFYAYGATVDDNELLGKLDKTPPKDSDVPAYFCNRGITLFRTVATDNSQDWKSPVDQEQISKCLSRARDFEIERTGDVLAFPRLPQDNDQSQNGCENLFFLLKKWDEASSLPQGSDPQQNVCGNEVVSNNDIQPPDEKIFPRFEKCVTILDFQLKVPKVAVAFAGAAILVLLTLCIP